VVRLTACQWPGYSFDSKVSYFIHQRQLLGARDVCPAPARGGCARIPRAPPVLLAVRVIAAEVFQHLAPVCRGWARTQHGVGGTALRTRNDPPHRYSINTTKVRKINIARRRTSANSLEESSP
jgi:hypothetical protein